MTRYGLTVLALCLGINAPAAAAATLKGTARNGTTGKPAAGDAVILMSLAGAATEIGRGKTDTNGRFRFSGADKQAPHLVRVVHQAVAYQAITPAGVNSVEVEVYDVVRKLDGVTATLDVQRLQTAGDTLQVIEEIALRNASDPPRTLVNDRPFEIQLPPEAQVVSGRVQTSGGQPVMRKPTPGDQNGRYYFPFPLLPGDSRFSVAYLLPYRGEAAFEPKILYPLENYIVVLPRSMKFEAKKAGMFQPMPGKTGSNVQEMAAVKPGEPLAFRVSGTGTLANLQGGQEQAQGRQAARSSGGLGAPAKPPAPLHNLGWFLLGGLSVVLAASVAGFRAHKRKQGLSEVGRPKRPPADARGSAESARC